MVFSATYNEGLYRLYGCYSMVTEYWEVLEGPGVVFNGP